MVILRNWLLGFMHQPSEPKSLSDWEEVGNPLILHNTSTHVQPEQERGNKEGSGGLKRCLYQDSQLETSGFDTMLGFMHQASEPKSLSDWEEVDNPLILHHCFQVVRVSGDRSGVLSTCTSRLINRD
jgi:hypothetical protein